MNTRTLILTAIGLLVAFLIGRAVVRTIWLGPRAELLSEIETVRERVERFAASEAQSVRTERTIRDHVDRTLGSDRETVDHRLRTRLNRIAERVGLQDAAVGTASFRTLESPMQRAFPRRGIWADLRDRPDFLEVEGSISGEGDLRTVLALVDAIRAETWLKRIDRVTLSPRRADDRYSISVRLTTILLPGREPDPVPPMAESGNPALVEALVAAAAFRVPAPAPPPEPPPPASSPPPGFPWADWRLTGTAVGPRGPEAWLRNRRTGETRVLEPGERIGEAMLRSIDPDHAVFAFPEGEAFVTVGGHLNERAPSDR